MIGLCFNLYLRRPSCCSQPESCVFLWCTEFASNHFWINALLWDFLLSTARILFSVNFNIDKIRKPFLTVFFLKYLNKLRRKHFQKLINLKLLLITPNKILHFSNSWFELSYDELGKSFRQFCAQHARFWQTCRFLKIKMGVWWRISKCLYVLIYIFNYWNSFKVRLFAFHLVRYLSTPTVPRVVSNKLSGGLSSKHPSAMLACGASRYYLFSNLNIAKAVFRPNKPACD